MTRSKLSKTAPASKAEPVRLDRSTVVSAALALIDAEGVDALTMRRLAQLLSVYPTALYWHAGTRAELLAAVCQKAFDEIELPPWRAESDWHDWLVRTALAVRVGLHRHPRLASLVGSQLQVASSSFALVEAILLALSHAGFRNQGLVDAYNVYVGCLFGWIFAELAADPVDAAEGWEDRFRTELRGVDRAVLPTLHANVENLSNNAFMLRWESGRTRPMPNGFEAAIGVVLTGLRASAPPTPRASQAKRRQA